MAAADGDGTLVLGDTFLRGAFGLYSVSFYLSNNPPDITKFEYYHHFGS
jgi:hypothetical protein